MNTFTKPAQQTGAAWAEFIVAASFVLISFFIGVPLLGKMIDAKQSAEQAARYATWERTVWFNSVPGHHSNKSLRKTNEEIQNELHHRVFGKKDSVIHSVQQKNGFQDSDLNPGLKFQNRNNFQYETMLRKSGTDYVTMTQVEEAPPGTFSSTLNGILSLFKEYGDFEVNQRGYFKTEVTVPIKEFAWMEEFKGIKPDFKAKGAILTDAWGTDETMAEKRAEALTLKPLVEKSGVNAILDFAIQIGGIFYVDLKNLELFNVDLDAVPEQRLEP